MLTGHWIGRFSYDDATAGRPVAFEARLLELGGSLSGETTEPNSFRPEPLLSLAATLTGWREGGNVGWRKTYSDFDQGDSPAYSGVVNRQETRIIGTWAFPSMPGFSGSFSMVRSPAAAARVARSKAAPVPTTSR